MGMTNLLQQPRMQWDIINMEIRPGELLGGALASTIWTWEAHTGVQAMILMHMAHEIKEDYVSEHQ